MIVRRAFLPLLLICLVLLSCPGCSAQSHPASQGSSIAPVLPPDVMQAVERQVRAYYSLPPSVKVIAAPLRPTEFANYDALTLTFDSPEKKHTYEFLLSRDHKTLIRISKMDLTKDPYAEIMKKIDVAARPSRGNKQAKVVVVNYDDFECPFCSRMHTTLFPEIFKEYGDRVLFVYKDYPLEEIHPWSVHAAINTNCLASQSTDAYWDYADYLHGNAPSINSMKGHDAQNAELDRLAAIQGQRHNLDTNKLAACIKQQDDSGVRASMNEAEGVGVDATPTMFINGEKLDGAVPASEIRMALDRALRDAGVPEPAHPVASSAPNGASPPAK